MNASKRTAKSGTRGVTLRTAGLSLRLDVRGAVVGLLLIAVALVMGVVLIGTGDFPIAPADVVRTLFGDGTVAQDFIVNELRLPRVLVGLLVGAAKANGGSEKDVDPGLTAVKRIAKNAATFDTTADVSNYFLQGQAAASVWGVSRTSTLAEKDFPIEFVYPKDGAIGLVTTANVVKKAPHEGLAQKFVAHLLEPSVQRALAKATYDGSVVQGVKEDPALKNKVVSTDKVDSLLKLDWKTINKNRSAWTDKWNKQVESK
ncbi:extracellular solute-binding protein [Streptomyces rubiginosohelvolus]